MFKGELTRIKGFSNYGVTRDGRVFNYSENREVLGCKNPDGYHNFRLKSDKGYYLTWGRHRLLAFVYIPVEDPIDDLVVNHKNGIKGDDRLENLEWVTYRENLYHAQENGYINICRPVSVRCSITGNVWFFPSINACAEYFNMTSDSIIYRLSFDEVRVFKELRQYREGISQEPWYTPSLNEIANIRTGRSRKVLVRDVETGKVIEFEKAKDAADFIGVSFSSMSIWLNKGEQPLIKHKYLVKWYDDEKPWRQLDNITKEAANTKGYKAIGVVLKDGTSLTFESAKKCAEYFNISPTLLHYRLTSSSYKKNTSVDKIYYI